MSKFDGMMNQHKKIFSLSQILTLDQYSSDDDFFSFRKFIAFLSHPLSRVFQCEHDESIKEEN